jgi:hypothetical protein
MSDGPIIVGTFKRNLIAAGAFSLGLVFIFAELYRRYHTIPHRARRTEYYRRLGITWKPIVD